MHPIQARFIDFEIQDQAMTPYIMLNLIGKGSRPSVCRREVCRDQWDCQWNCSVWNGRYERFNDIDPRIRRWVLLHRASLS